MNNYISLNVKFVVQIACDGIVEYFTHLSFCVFTTVGESSCINSSFSYLNIMNCAKFYYLHRNAV